MADNTPLNLGSGGDTISTDDIGGGVKVQRVKVQVGADGAAADVHTGNPLPVSDAGGALSVDDNGSSLSVDDGGGSITVDGTVGVSSLPALPAGTNNIGDVDVLSVVPGTGATNLGKQEDSPHTSSDVGVYALAVRRDTASNGGAADGDYTSFTTDNAGRLRVTQADVTQPISDAGGSLTVDAPVGTPVNVQIGDGTRQATVRDTGPSDALNVAVVDASGNQITTFSGGTEYTEDAPAAADPVGQMLMARRRDTPTAAEVSADGDNIALITTAEGYLRTAVSGTVNVADGGGLLSVDDGGGTVSVDDGGGSITVDGTLAVTGIGSGATDLGKAEDASHVTGHVGVLSLAVRRDSPTSGVDADGDYTALSTDSTGALRVTGAGGGTQYVEDAVAATDPTGTALMMVRADALAAVTSANGDNVAARGTNNGELYVKHVDTITTKIVDVSGNDASDDANNSIRVSIVAGGGAGGTAMADDAAFTVGTTNITPVGGTYKSTRDQVDDNDAGAFAMTQRRAVYAALETPNGDSLADDTADALKVVGNVASGVTLTGGPVVAGARSGTSAPADVGSDGAAVALRATRKGELFVTVADEAGDSCMDGANNALRVSVINGAAGGTSMNDDAAFTVGTTAVTPTAGTYRVTRDLVDDGDAGAFAMTQRRAQLVVPETVGGVAMTDEVNNALKVSMVDAASNLLGVATKDTLFNLSLTAVDTSATVATGGRAVVAFELQGTFVATAQFEASIDDGATWFSVRAFVSGVTPAAVTSATATGRWYAHVAGFSHFRVRVSAYTSGTVVVWIGASSSNTSQGLVHVGDGGLTLSIDDGGGSITVDGAGTSQTDDAAFTPGASLITPMGGTYRITRDNLDDADAGCVALTQKRAQYVSIEDGSGVPAAVGNGNNANALRVAIASDSSMPGTVVEDAASAGAEVSHLVAAVRRDTVSSGVGTDGDFANLAVNANGRLYVAATVDAALPAGTNNIGDVDVLTLPALPAGTNNIGDVDVLTLPGVTGAAAHDAAVSGNPVLVGLEARTAVGTAVTSGDASRALADVFGKQVVVVGAFFEEHLRGSANFTNTTAADIIAAQGAGIKIAVMGVTVVNGHATVGTKVTVRDKTTTTKKIVGYAAALGGGFAPCGATPLLISDANSAIEAVCGTTGADVDVNVWGFLIKN